MSRRCPCLRRPDPFPSPRCSSLALLAAGCGGSTERERGRQVGRQGRVRGQEPEADPRAHGADRREKVDPTPGEADINTKPKVPKGTGAAPTALKAETLIAGNGAEIKSGQQATVNYVGVLFKDGKEFDTSWGKGKQPFQFALGSGQVIPGWDQGVLGMKVGERRRLTIPADLAYGAQGSPPKIGPNEPLIFDIDLKKIG